jgi:hypothetical protein
MGTSFSAVRLRLAGGGATAALLALALVFSTGSRAFAADLSVTSGNTLNVTGATAAAVLPEAQASGGATTPTAATPTAENEWLSGLHISGYLSQQFGMW